VLSTDSIVYVFVVFFMLQLRFASYLINEYVMLCYVMSTARRFEQIDRAARDRSFSAASPRPWNDLPSGLYGGRDLPPTSSGQL